MTPRAAGCPRTSREKLAPPSSQRAWPTSTTCTSRTWSGSWASRGSLSLPGGRPRGPAQKLRVAARLVCVPVALVEAVGSPPPVPRRQLQGRAPHLDRGLLACVEQQGADSSRPCLTVDHERRQSCPQAPL